MMTVCRIYLYLNKPKHGHFHNVQECTDFVNKNPEPFIRTMWKFYGQNLLKELYVFVERSLKKSWHNKIV